MSISLKYWKISRPVFAIYLDSLLTNLGYFILIPILTIVLAKTKNLSLSEVATAVFFITISARSAKFFTGSLLDSINLKTSLVAGVCLAGLSYLAMGYVNTVPLLIPFAMLAGLGASANALTVKSLVANIASKDGHGLIYYSAINVFVNIAALIGAWLGSLLLARNLSDYIFQIAGMFYLLAGLLVFLLLKNTEIPEESVGRINFWNGYKKVLSDKAYLKILPFNLIGWFCYGQLYSTVPYFVSARFGTEDKIGMLYMVNALAVILLQIPITKYVLKILPKDKPIYQLFASYVLFCLAFFSMGIYPTFTMMFVMIIIFTLAEMLLTPSVDAIVSSHAPPEVRTTYFSVMSISRALGEAFGSYFGLNWLGFWVGRNQHGFFWLSIAALMGIASVSFLLMLRREIKSSH